MANDAITFEDELALYQEGIDPGTPEEVEEEGDDTVAVPNVSMREMVSR